MPTYNVKDPSSGRTLRLTGDSHPTEAELNEIFTSSNSRSIPSLTEQLSSSAAQQATGDEVIDALLFAQKEVVGPLAQGANTAAFGLPKFLTQKIAGEEFAQQAFPQQSTGLGKLARFGSEATGLIQGGAAKLGTMAASKILPKTASGVGLKAAKETPGAIRGSLRTMALKQAGRGAIEGGVAGASQIIDPDLDIQQQLGQGVVGAGLGAITGGFSTPAIKTMGRMKNKFFRPAKRSILTRLNEVSRSKNISFVDKQKAINQEIKLANDNAFAAIGKNIRVMDEELEQSSTLGAKEIQSSIKNFSRASSDAYGQFIDDISDVMAQNNQNVTLGNMNDLFEKTINELDEVGLSSGQARNILENIKKKYVLEVIEGVDNQGANIVRYRDASQQIPLREVLKDVRSITRTLSDAASAGTKRFKPEDVAVSVFRKNTGELINELSGGAYGDLNRQYGPVANTVKQAYKTFKPGQEELGLKQGIELIKRISRRENPNFSELELIKRLQEGVDIGGINIAGVGDVTGRAMKAGESLRQSKELIKSTRSDFAQNKISKLNELAKQRRSSDKTMSSRKKSVQDLLAQEKINKIALGTVGGLGTSYLLLNAVLEKMKGNNR